MSEFELSPRQIETLLGFEHPEKMDFIKSRLKEEGAEKYFINEKICSQIDIDNLRTPEEHLQNISNGKYKIGDKYDATRINNLVSYSIVTKDEKINAIKEGIEKELLTKKKLLDDKVLSNDEVLELTSATEHCLYIIENKYDKDIIDKLRNNNIVPEDQIFTAIRMGIKKGYIKSDDYILKGIITEDEYDEKIMTKDDHIDAIRQGIYDHSTIRILNSKKIITKEDLKNKANLTDDTIFFILNGYYEPLTPTEININDIPASIKGRTDVFILGVATSGKTMMLAGVLSTAYDDGNLTIEIPVDHSVGREYFDFIYKAIKEKRLVGRTRATDFQYMNVDIIEERNSAKLIHPLTMYEMGGELFQDLRTDKEVREHKKIKEHIFNSTNDKVIIFVIDYYEHLHPTQKHLPISHFDAFLRNIEEKNLVKDIAGILTVVTKWDIAEKENIKLPDDQKITPKKFIEDNYRGLDTRINKIVEMKKKKVPKDPLIYKKMTFSLGDFKNENRVYEFKKDNSRSIYQWLCDVTKHR